MEAAEQVSLKHKVIEWIKFAILMVLLYLTLHHVVGFERVSGLSMSPTLKDGSLLLVNKISMYLSKPKYGDVVVISQEGKGYQIIKRVVGLPGDSVVIKNGALYINNQPLPEVYVLGKSQDIPEVKVGEGQIFVIGDNRTPGESLDSRSPDIGPLLMSSIKGYAVVSVFPMYKIMKPLKLE
jgi:signal peptidase I